jgi:hypothetical protein
MTIEEEKEQTMTLSPYKTGTEFHPEGIPTTHEIVYFVKRSLCEFCFAIPKSQSTFERNGGPLFQVRLTGQNQLHGLVLELDETEDFFDRLSRLIDYIHAEIAKRLGKV